MKGTIFTICCLVVLALRIEAQSIQYNISTVAGGGSIVGDGLLGISASLNAAFGVAISSSGEVYIADSNNHRIRKLSTSGYMSTVAGTGGVGFSGDNILATNAKLYSPRGVTLSSTGEVYIADTANHRIRKISTSGYMSTVAGTGGFIYNGDDILATSATLSYPSQVVLSSTGEIYIVDSYNHRIRKISTMGNISTIAGTGAGGYNDDNILATTAKLNYPMGMAISSSGEIYIADSNNHAIRKISTSGKISTIAGTRTAGYNGDSIQATTAQLKTPGGVTINSVGEVFIADNGNNRIRKISTSGIISTIAGTEIVGYNGDGIQATSAQLFSPSSIAISSIGEVYIADSGNSRIRKISTSGHISTIVGTASFGNNIRANLAYVSPIGNPTFHNGNLVFVDTSEQIRQVDLSTNIISTILGTAGSTTIIQGFSGLTASQYYNNILYVLYSSDYIDMVNSSVISKVAGIFGYNGDNIVALSAQLYNPTSVLMSSSGEIYIADSNNHRIRKLSTSGYISTIAGTGTGGYNGDGIQATSANLFYPTGLAISSSELYIADKSNHRIRKISTSGIITTIAGTGTAGYGGDDGLSTTWILNNPTGVAINSNGEIYIADSNNHRVRKISAGVISTIAGTGTGGYNGDDILAKTAQLFIPYALAISSSGEIYIADSNNHRIRKISTSGYISTVVGSGTAAYGGDNGLATSAQINNPYGVTVSSTGEVYIADSNNYRIRKVSTSGVISTIAGGGSSSGEDILATSTQLTSPQGVAISSSGEIYIAETLMQRVRKISTSGKISTIAGGVGDGGPADGAYISAVSFEISSSGEIYIADTNNHRIRKVSTSGFISTIAGTGYNGFSGDNGLATSAQIYNPYGVTVSSTGEVYIADSNNHRIRKVSTSGIISTIAGTGDYGYNGDGILATSANLYNPYGITVTSTGEVFIVDSNNHRIRKISTSGIITTIAGTGTAGYNGDDLLSTEAQLNFPYGLAISSKGEVYISDNSNNRLRKLTPYCTENALLIDGKCFFQCFGATNLNSTVCSGKGSCYGNNKCNCTDPLYFGSKCNEFYCFGLLNTDTSACFSRGNCTSANKCSCQNGYYGESCQYFSCNSIPFNSSLVCSTVGSCVGLNNCSCNAGYYGSNCQYFDCYGTSSNNSGVCSSHGLCRAPNNCSCSIGYYDYNCAQYNCYNINYSNSSVCSSRGKCISSNNCTCDTGYYGANCEIYNCKGIPKTNAHVCSSHGVCSSFDNCTCQQGFAGLECENFNCYGVLNIDSKVCSSHGICSSLNNCTCTNGYFGSNCDQYSCYDVLFTNKTVCSGKGTCSSPNNCTCDSGYYGSNCEIYDCFGVPKNNSNVCTGHGTCTSLNNCTCSDGYYDFKCESFNCVGVRFSNQSLCQNNGTCIGPGNCACPYQYGGARCEYYKCYSYAANEAKACGGHGTCLNYNNCSCSDNWFGEDCSVTTCFNTTSNSSSVCGGRGNCTNLNQCTCNNGYRGTECEHTVCYGRIDSEIACSGYGKCVSPNNCSCEIGYVGEECQYHEIYLNTSSAILFSFHESLMKLLPNNSEIFSCSNIFGESEIAKLGELSSVICQWRRKSIQIHLGFDYSIDHNSIIHTKFNFSFRINSLAATTNVDAPSPTCSFGYLLTETSPLLDIVIRLNCDENLHGFKKTKTVWTCSQCNGAISSLLNSYSNKSSVYIPISLMNSLNPIQGYKTINLQASYSSVVSSNIVTTKEVKVQSYTKSLPPNYYWISENYATKTYSCISHNCIIETSLNSLNSSISYSFSGFFSLLNTDLYSKQMVRMINEYSGGVLDSEFNSNMQVFGVQLKTYVYLPYSIDSFKYSTFTNLDFVMTGVNRTYSINSDSVIKIGLTIDDPFISKYTLSDYMEHSWQCYKVSPYNRSVLLTDNLCGSIENTRSYLELDINKMSLQEGAYLIYSNISSTKYFVTTVYKYEGFVYLVGISKDSPQITTDYLPAITPSHKDIYIRNVVKSSSTVSFSWTLKRGQLNIEESVEDFLQISTFSKTIMDSNLEIILDIDNVYLIQGEFYEFELATKNSNGFANISISTRIDFSPRLSCNVENLKNDNMTSFESLVSITCLKLPYESISSFVMEFYSQRDRLGVISNTPKRALITRVPYSADGTVRLVVKLQNLYGSVGIYSTNVNVQLPNGLPNDNSILSRVIYVSKQFQILKNSQPIKIEVSNEINALLSLLIQNGTMSDFNEKITKELQADQLASFNSMLREMLSIIKSLQDITYKVDERLIQLVLQIVNKISTILKSTLDIPTLSTNFASDLEIWLNWIYSGMDKALNYYPTFIYKDLLDEYHLQEIISLQNILSNVYQSNLDQQFKLHKYNLQYIKLTGSNSNNSSFVEDFEYSDLLNDKVISLSVSNFKVDLKLPSDFSKQISLNSKSKLFYSIAPFSTNIVGSKLLQNKPIVELSLYDTSFNAISVERINPPIIIKFQGLVTSNKTSINTTCVYYEPTSGKWSTSGLESTTNIIKRTEEYIYFDMECHSSHLSVFSIQELDLTIPPTAVSSNGASNQDSNLTIILSTVLPIGFLILVFIIILVAFMILLFRNRKHKRMQEFAIANKTDIELEGFSSMDFPSDGSMFIQPLMSISSNGTTSEAFNPLSRYSDLVRIGKGAFGSVFKAYDSKTSSVKAIKVIKYTSMEELNNFMKEGSQLMNVSHPYILRVNEFFVSKDQLLCIDMDFYELGDLVKLTNVEIDCSEKLIKQIIYQMCSALYYIHCNMKIIHRDIKPSNIFVKSLENDNIHIIVADFGLAKSNIGASTNNSYAGTPIFMSPELGLGGKYYYNTDIYSLGVTIYQIMTKDTFTSISQLHLGKEQSEVTDLLRKKLQDGGQYSARLVELVLLMLTRDNLIRPQAQDILEDSYFNDLKR